MNTNPVLVVEDDTDDHNFVRESWEELKYTNPLIFFTTGEEAMNYLKATTVSPFLILCDVNVRRMDGFELKAK